MKEVKQPSKKPLVYYYLVALLILMVLNLTLFPAMLETPVQDVTYDQFMCGIESDWLSTVRTLCSIF